MKKNYLLLLVFCGLFSAIRAQYGWYELSPTAPLPVYSPYESVNTMVTDTAGNLYVSGFEDTSEHMYVWKWNGSKWSILGGANGDGNPSISNICIDKNGNIYKGEAINISSIDRTSTNVVEEWNGTEWVTLDDANYLLNQEGQFNAPIGAMCVDNAGNVYVAVNPDLEYYDDSVIYPGYVVVWNGNTWNQLGYLNENSNFSALCADTYGNIYAATPGNENTSDDLEEFNVTNGFSFWQSIGTSLYGYPTVGPIQPNCLYADNFGNVDGTNSSYTFDESFQNGIIQWNNGWTQVGSTNIDLSGECGGITALTADDSGYIYIGGNFAENSCLNSVLKWNGSYWGPLGTGNYALNANSGIFAMCTDNKGHVFAGGSFKDPQGNIYVAEYGTPPPACSAYASFLWRNVGTEVQFINTSTDSLNFTNQWTFYNASGVFASNTSADPMVNFTGQPPFRATLIITDALCTDTFNETISLQATCLAHASFTQQNIGLNRAQFTNTSTDNISFSSRWTFYNSTGIFTTSNATNPLITFTGQPPYGATLFITDSVCSDSSMQVVNISSNNCNANASFTQQYLGSGEVQFTNTSTINTSPDTGTSSFVIWSDNFNAPAGGADHNNAGLNWSGNTLTPGGKNEEDEFDITNFWTIDSTTMPAGICGAGNKLYVSNNYGPPFVGNYYYSGDYSDIYDATPNISTIGDSGMTLSFTWRCKGVAGKDYGLVGLSSDSGATFTWLPKQYQGSTACQNALITIPANYNNISTFKIAFRFIAGNSNEETDPPFEIDNIVLTNNGAGTANNSTFTSHWIFDNSTGEFDTSNATNPLVTYTGQPPYSVTLIITDSICSDTLTEVVNISSNTCTAHASFTQQDLGNNEVQFTNTSTDANTYNSYWAFYNAAGVLITSTASNPLITFSGNGPYTAYLLIIDSLCADTASQTVNISSSNTSGDYSWTVKNPFGGAGRKWAAAFTLNNEGYVVGGETSNTTYASDAWRYNATTDSWTQIASYPNTFVAAGYFAINNIGYVVGGAAQYGLDQYQSTGYSYNPATNTWSPIASLPEPMGECFSFVINGIGYIGSGISSSMYAYNPANNTWTSVAPFPGNNGINMIGFSWGSYGYAGLGSNGDAAFYNDFYQYDPSTNTWTQIPDFPGIPRANATAFVIDGTAFVGAGVTDVQNTAESYNLSDFYEYDFAANTWTRSSGEPSIASSFPAAFVINDNAYLTGGGDYYNSIYSNQVSEFGTCQSLTSNGNTAAFGWIDKNAFTGPGRAVAASFTLNGYGYLVGGATGDNAYASDAWQYNPANDSWSQIASYPEALWQSMSFAINNIGYIAGGSLPGDVAVSSCYSYNPATSSWTAIASLPQPMSKGYGFSVNGIGYVGQGVNPGMYAYTPATNSWSQKASFPGPSNAINLTAFTIDSLAYVGLGTDGNDNFYNQFYQYNPSTNSWQQVAAFPGIPRSNAVAFVINGRAFVGGGTTLIQGTTNTYNLGDFYEYDPVANTWSPVSGLPSEGLSFPVTFVINNNAYIATGQNYYNDSYTNLVSEFVSCGSFSLACSANASFTQQSLGGGQVQFTNTSTDNIPFTASWTFYNAAGAFTTSTVTNPLITFSGQPPYSATLVISDSICSDTLSLVLTIANSNCITLQQGATKAVGAHIDDYFPNQNEDFTGYPDFDTYQWTEDGTPIKDVSLLQFNLSQIPAGSVIVSAKLNLYADSLSAYGYTGQPTYGSNNASYLHRVTSPWNPASVTWNTEPSVSNDSEVLLPQSTSTDENYLNIDLSSFVQDWVDNPSANYGMLLEIIGQSYYNSMIFCSPGNADSTKWPSLEVCYLPPASCGVVASFTYQNLGSGVVQFNNFSTADSGYYSSWVFYNGDGIFATSNQPDPTVTFTGNEPFYAQLTVSDSILSQCIGFADTLIVITGNIDSLENDTLCGFVFDDINQDGVYDSGDVPASHVPLIVDGAVYYTNSGGYYTVSVGAGLHQISVVPPYGWTQTTPLSPTAYSVTTSTNQRICGFDFGIANTATGVHDLGISSDMVIFPNPLNAASFKILVPDGFETVNASVHLEDMLGREVSVQYLNIHQKLVSVNLLGSLTPGIYLVVLSNDTRRLCGRLSVIR